MKSSALVCFALAQFGECARLHLQTNYGDNVDQKIGRLCPPGLRPNHTAETCSWDGGMFDDPDRNANATWGKGSGHPLVFAPFGGLEDAEGELLQELRFVVTNPEFVHSVVSTMHHHPHHHTLVHDLGSVHESLEHDAENLAAVEFVAEHAVEHIVLETLVFGLSHLTEAAVHAGLTSAAFALEGAVVGLEVVGHVLASPLVLGYSAVRTAYLLRNHWLSKDARSREFAVAMVAKADCIVSKVELHHEQIFTQENGHGVDPTFFVPELEQVCGKPVEMQLAEQMVRTNKAMVDLFKEFKGIGKCLFPEGPRLWSKSNCVAAIYEPLREHEGEPGLLYSALGLAAAYAQESDEVLAKPVYSEWFDRYFNITLPPPSSTVQQNLIRVRDNNAGTMQEHATTCVTIVGMHRAFERIFIRLKTALEIYMHTFARETLHWTTRTTIHPCRRIFRKLEDREQGLCKEGLDLPMVSPDTEWLMAHAEHLSENSLADAGECIEDTHPEISLSIFNSGPAEGENEEEERTMRDEE